MLIWSTMLSKHFQRQVKSLCVFCRHEDRGCEWLGELAAFHTHFQSCPKSYALQTTEYVSAATGTESSLNATSRHTQQEEQPQSYKKPNEELEKWALQQLEQKLADLVRTQREVALAQENLDKVQEGQLQTPSYLTQVT
ncbi:hypothetical protein GBAR_LOCUS11637 [Geodia barretti]|uniref:Uncharacterized protein n=1 Tax=Geodia barretti TaxID=519541 RepID=A0AA35RX68_GEOBA|nr:hypothetical protein GBAR_LOCUS11637 [Geodia barretti]